MLDRLSHSCFALFPAPAVLLASISPSTPNMDAHGTPGGLSGTPFYGKKIKVTTYQR